MRLSIGSTIHFILFLVYLLFQIRFLVFTTFTSLAILSYIHNFVFNKFLAPLLGIGAVCFLSMEVDILKNR